MNDNEIINVEISLIQCMELIKTMRKEYNSMSDNLKRLYKLLEGKVTGYLTIHEAQEFFSDENK